MIRRFSFPGAFAPRPPRVSTEITDPKLVALQRWRSGRIKRKLLGLAFGYLAVCLLCVVLPSESVAFDAARHVARGPFYGAAVVRILAEESWSALCRSCHAFWDHVLEPIWSLVLRPVLKWLCINVLDRSLRLFIDLTEMCGRFIRFVFVEFLLPFFRRLHAWVWVPLEDAVRWLHTNLWVPLEDVVRRIHQAAAQLVKDAAEWVRRVVLAPLWEQVLHVLRWIRANVWDRMVELMHQCLLRLWNMLVDVAEHLWEHVLWPMLSELHRLWRFLRDVWQECYRIMRRNMGRLWRLVWTEFLYPYAWLPAYEACSFLANQLTETFELARAVMWSCYAAVRVMWVSV